MLAILACAFTSFSVAVAQQPAASAAQTKPANLPVPARSTPARSFLVVLDPAHGGSNNGAMLADGTPEKNYTLDLAVRLHVLLNARGISSILTRDTDATIDDDTRAETANRAQAAACVLLHATSTGSGVHLFTSSLPAPQSTSSDPRRAFLPWQTAQTRYVTRSLHLESDLNATLAAGHVPVLLDKTSLAPLDRLACPAVAVEVAPLDANTPVTDAAYRQRIAQALAAALAAWRDGWRTRP